RARSLAPVSDTDVWLVAPDFAYGTSRGETKALKDHRGDKIVLLVLLSLPESRDRLEQLEKMAARLASAGVEIILVANDTERYRRVVDSKAPSCLSSLRAMTRSSRPMRFSASPSKLTAIP